MIKDLFRVFKKAPNRSFFVCKDRMEDCKIKNIICLVYPKVWYTAKGGTTALAYMIKDLESALFG